MGDGSTDLDPRTPVLVGVGTCLDDAEPAELMARAALAAGQDAGVPDLLRSVDQIAVTRGTWAYPDPGRIIRDRIGADGARTVLVELGIPQQTVIDDALVGLRDGRLDVALVSGGEAKARAARAARSSTKGDAAGMAKVFVGQGTAEGVALETEQGDVVPDEVRSVPPREMVDDAELAAGLWAPVDQYALIESALGAAEGRTNAELRIEVDELYARFNEVATSNPEAAFPDRMTAADLGRWDERNRPLSFPYAKWHVTQWTVDQAAALLLTTVDRAESLGVPHHRWVFPLVGLGSSHMVPVSQRAELHRWPAMRVLGEAAAQRLGHPLAECDHHDLYSCFPVAVRVQQRELGLPLDGTPTITGGMAFAGGPLNSYVFQSTATMIRRVRETGGRGLVTSVSGFLTKPGIGVWASESDGRPPLLADLAEPVAAATARVPVLAAHDGPGRVAAATVQHEALEPQRVVALVDTPAGARVICTSEDRELAQRAVERSIVGDRVLIAGTTLTV